MTNLKLNKTQLNELSNALAILAKHGINPSDISTTESDTVNMAQKTIKQKTKPTRRTQYTPNSNELKQISVDSELKNAIQWAKNNPYAFTFAELEETMGKPSKLTQNQYNKLKLSIKQNNELITDINKSLKKHDGVYKVLEFQRFLTFKFDLFICPYQCGTLLNQIFKFKDSELWYEKVA